MSTITITMTTVSYFPLHYQPTKQTNHNDYPVQTLTSLLIFCLVIMMMMVVVENLQKKTQQNMTMTTTKQEKM